MATGFMVLASLGKATRYSTHFFIALCLATGVAAAQDVGLAGVMGSKAMLVIDGGEPELVSVGHEQDGVKVIAVQEDRAIVEIGGKKRPLRVGQHAFGAPAGDGSGKVVLAANAEGHFLTTGTVNGTAVRFLVDTGATMISLGATDARRIGLDFEKGQKALTRTANGDVVVSKVTLDTVKVGDITLHNVDALIHPNELPAALLGMSFLNRMEMQRDGDKMTLKKRF